MNVIQLLTVGTKCPSCKRCLVVHHCTGRGCPWLKCTDTKDCGRVFDPRSGNSFVKEE